MATKKIKKDDEVIVIAGRDKGKRGTVLRVLDDQNLLVDGVNMVKKHTKPNPNAGITGGIIEKEAKIHRSNVMLYNPATEKGDRVVIQVGDDGKKRRVFKSTNELVEA